MQRNQCTLFLSKLCNTLNEKVMLTTKLIGTENNTHISSDPLHTLE